VQKLCFHGDCDKLLVSYTNVNKHQFFFLEKVQINNLVVFRTVSKAQLEVNVLNYQSQSNTSINLNDSSHKVENPASIMCGGE
jgi:hypothetical protein